MRLLKEIDWSKFKTVPFYMELKKEIDRLYSEHCQNGIAVLKFSEYITFFEDGSRMAYEKLYFSRRAQLNALTALTLIDGDEYIKDLQNVIWEICNEYSWALPSHGSKDIKDINYIDLFAAETGFALSEILYIMGDKLDSLIRDRITYEIERRIIDSYMKREFFWENCDNNWGAVCAGSVGATFIYMNPERFHEVADRIGNALNKFLDGFTDDGVCLEGLMYWKYGFGFFAYYAQILREFNGYDYFKNDKVKRIASYQHKTFLQGNTVMSFSDNGMTGTHNIGLTHFLKKQYPEDVRLIDFDLRSSYINGTGDWNYRWAVFVRDLVWSDDGLYETSEPEKFFHFPKAGQYVNKKSNYAFAAKAGKNEEPHNHNDVGSFILAVGGRQVLCDIGAGEYTRQYFSEERYSFICNSSFGHSVPIVNGCEQKFGWMYDGSILEATPETLVMEISKAYGNPELTRLERRFDFTENGLTMTDSYSFLKANVPVTERFVTMIKPEQINGEIILNDVKISCNYNFKINTDKYKNHSGDLRTLYFIDYEITGESAIFNIEVTREIKKWDLEKILYGEQHLLHIR